MIALREAWKAGLFGREHWTRNLVAGVIVGVVALPLAMAFAIASGVKPEQGIYTAIFAGALVSLLGGSRVQIAGPTGAFIVILAGVTAKYGIDGLQIATLMAGVILVLLGVSRLGSIIRFIPAPVIVGFTAGIGVIIWVGQWKDFFGLPAVTGEHFHQKLWHLIQALPQLHIATTLLALLSLALVLFTPRIAALRRVPGPLVAMVVVTAIQSLFHFDGVATIGSAFGGIPQGLPSFSLPEVTLPRVLELIGPAFAIAMLGAIESLLSAVVADGMAGTRHDSNQELIGQGIANLVTPLFGGIAATGAIARTATNIRNGGNSPLAGVTHAATLVLILLFLAPLASNIPLCALAAILFVVAWNMSEARHFLFMLKRAPRADVGILLVTFLLTVFSDLVIAVNIGVILAMLHFLRRMASSVDVHAEEGPELEVELRGRGLGELPPGVLVYSIEGPLFFGAAETFERALAKTHTDPKVLIIRLRHVPFMDITGLQTLQEVIEQLQRRGIEVRLCEANARVLGKLRKAGVLEEIGAGYHPDFPAALSAASSEVAGETRT
ncbi:SulP family inorganic anion transporter [Pseudomonas pseudonitroreducens]|uniref:SulP family inorganic anion transporter n=1 Tax=Pseudomonas pseudonitroreducens TaxID=2892326 RepID=UPI001F3028ED|nr:sulfate permease [Pseudomonas pseudonitroreducens]